MTAPYMGVYVHGVEYVKAPEQPAPSTMDYPGARALWNQLDKSGFNYAMVDYSNYDHGRNLVADERFHQLRNRFLAAREELLTYVTEELKKHDLEFE